MKRFISVLLLLTLLVVATAHADWRWADPRFEKQQVAYFCENVQCIKAGRLHVRMQRQAKLHRYNQQRLREWNHWTHLSLPNCIWYGESGVGPKYARYRYTIFNSQGSGARGKFQFMPSTYHANAKYHDWSALDQEIAARREYEKHGSAPWAAC